MLVELGSRFGDYEVVAPLGSGGMGEVYRVRDHALGRDIALKVLQERFALDPHKISRFTREARMLAALNHPNIATLHGVAQHGGRNALLLELVEGDTLDERIAGRPLGLEEALAIAQQIAAALTAAHEHGIVHRDLKPANIKLRPDGTVKLLDFGLAKILDPAAPGAGADVATVTALDLVPHGSLLGTPAYMSPEQARGLKVDQRGDVWAFGCILYEMLTGARAFSGDTVSDTVAAILEREPDWPLLARRCPPPVQRLVRRCLTKSVRDRLQHIGDARADLGDAAANVHERRGGTWPRNAAAVIGAVAFALLGAVLVNAYRLGDSAPLRYEIVPRPQLPLVLRGYTRDLAIAPDGRFLAYSSANGSLVVRSVEDLTATHFSDLGPEVSHPLFSPDGKHVVFVAGAALKRLSLESGAATVIAGIGDYTDWSAVWGPEDSIILASTRGLVRVPAQGGRPEVLAMPDGSRGERAFGTPEMLPGGAWVVHAIRPMRPEGSVRLVAFNLKTRERKELLRGGTQPRYLPSGHLVYALDNTLQAVSFDADRLEVRSAPATVATDVMVNDNGTASYGVAENGTLVYVHGTLDTARRRLAWVTRDGAETVLAAPSLNYVYPRLSPDNKQVALDVREPEGDIWTWDLERGLLTRITFDPAENPLVAWSPDGRHLAFGDGRSGTANVYRQALDGGALERLTESDARQVPVAYTPDGTGLIFGEAQPEGGWDAFVLRLDEPRRIEPLLRGPASEVNVEPSRDGRWIAYASDESGRFEIYVRSFPDTSEAPQRISRDGGSKPLWSPDGTEIYFVSPDRKLMAAQLAFEPRLEVRGVAALFDASPYVNPEFGTGSRPFDISNDGQRFLMLRLPDSDTDPLGQPRVVVVLNWLGEVKRRVADGA